MSNMDKYIDVFKTVFLLEADALPGLEYQAIPAWDSVGHMNLMALLEESFDIMMDTDDIVDFNSFEKGKEILAKYDVVLD